MCIFEYAIIITKYLNMSHNSNLYNIVEFSLVFEEDPKELKDYLQGISRSMILQAAAFFLGFNNHNSRYRDYIDLIQMFFCEENQEFLNQIHGKLKELEEQDNGIVTIINARSSLQLFEFAFDNLGEDEFQTNAEAEINIFKAYLLLNQEITRNEDNIEATTQTLPSELKLTGLLLTQSFPYADIQNYNASELLASQMIKSLYLFEFLESNEVTNNLLEHYLAYYKSNTWQEHLKSLFPLAIRPLMVDKESYTDIIVEKNDEFNDNIDFIEKLIIKDTESIQDHDYRNLRSSPYYKVDEGVYRLTFIVFAIELLHKGIYFKLNEINSNLPEEKQLKGLRSLYCHKFSENYLLYSILNSIYTNKYIKFSGDEILQYGIEAEPDYYIRNGNKIFLFESKDILINADVKSSFDYTVYEKEFKKKLYYDSNGKKIKKKAVLQLINNIQRLLNGQLNFDTNYKFKSATIYPILILHDHQFNVAGLNSLVNHWFTLELKKLEKSGINIYKVKPITIINIDTLIYMQDPLRSNQIRLERVIDEYHKHCKINPKRKYKDQDHLRKVHLDANSPFSVFAVNYARGQRIRLVPKMIKEKGITLFNDEINK